MFQFLGYKFSCLVQVFKTSIVQLLCFRFWFCVNASVYVSTFYGLSETKSHNTFIDSQFYIFKVHNKDVTHSKITHSHNVRGPVRLTAGLCGAGLDTVLFVRGPGGQARRGLKIKRSIAGWPRRVRAGPSASSKWRFVNPSIYVNILCVIYLPKIFFQDANKITN